MKFNKLHTGGIKAIFVFALMLVCVFSLSAQSFDGYYDDEVVVNRNVKTMGIYSVSVNTAENDYTVLFYAKGERAPLASYSGKYQYWVYRRGFGYQDWMTPAFDMSQIDLTKILTTVDSRININRTGLDKAALKSLSQYLDPSVCYDDNVVVDRSVKTMGIYSVSVNTAENDYTVLFYAKGERAPLASYSGKYQYWVYRRGFGYQDWMTPAFDMSQIDLTKILVSIDPRIPIDRTGVDKNSLMPLSGVVGSSKLNTNTGVGTTVPKNTSNTDTSTGVGTTVPKNTSTTNTATTTNTVIPTTTTVAPKNEIVILDTPDETDGWYDDAAEYNTSATSMGPYSIFYNIREGRWALAMFSYPGDSSYIACYDLMYQYWRYRRGYNGYQSNATPYFDMSKVDLSKMFKKVDSSINLNRTAKGEDGNKDGPETLKALSSKAPAINLGDIEIDGKVYEKTGFIKIDTAGKTVIGSDKVGAFIKGRNVEFTYSLVFGKYPVTQELYEVVAKKIPAKYTKPSSGTSSSLTPGENQGLRPVEAVDFFEVAAFCNKLSELQGLEPVFTITGNDVTFDITKNGWRIPTDAEWEYAARGGNPDDSWTWSNTYGTATLMKELQNYAWFKENNSQGNTHEVGLKKPSTLGLYDMYGNVFQWCIDRYDESLSRGSFKDPVGAASGTERVYRGCGKSSIPREVTTRFYTDQTDYFNNLGFRLCRTVKVSAADAMASKPLSLKSFYLSESMPDYGVRSGGYAELSGDTLNVYIPISFEKNKIGAQSSYYVQMVVAGNDVCSIKSPSVRNYEAEDGRGNADFYPYDELNSSTEFGWNLNDGDLLEIVYKDGSTKTLKAKVNWVPALYCQFTYSDGYRPNVLFQYLDVDSNYELKASDIILTSNTCRAEIDELVKLTSPYYDADQNGAWYKLYYKNVKTPGKISIAVKRNGLTSVNTRYEPSIELSKVPVDFGDITLNGKTYEKTSFIEVESQGTYVDGSGKDGVFIDGRSVYFTYSYMLGKYPVTQGLYSAVASQIPDAYSNPSKGTSSTLTAGEVQDLRPVEQVDFYEVAAFCNKLSELHGLEPVFTIKGDTVTFDITKNGWRIPTEAEWEFAARGGDPSDETTWNYLYGNTSNAKQVMKYSWLKDNSDGNTHEVGLKEPSPNGLYDMFGNVFVWCLDWYGTVEKGSVTDPVGAASGTKRVFRGYSKGSATPRAATGRLSAEQSKYFIDVGIRLCRTLK